MGTLKVSLRSLQDGCIYSIQSGGTSVGHTPDSYASVSLL